jgi:hypothetical protein
MHLTRFATNTTPYKAKMYESTEDPYWDSCKMRRIIYESWKLRNGGRQGPRSVESKIILQHRITAILVLGSPPPPRQKPLHFWFTQLPVCYSFCLAAGSCCRHFKPISVDLLRLFEQFKNFLPPSKLSHGCFMIRHVQTKSQNISIYLNPLR